MELDSRAGGVTATLSEPTVTITLHEKPAPVLTADEE
jgi:hypothetical protein